MLGSLIVCSVLMGSPGEGEIVPSPAEPRGLACRAWLPEHGGNGNLYMVVGMEHGISWSEAQWLASSAGGHLATPTTVEENAFVFSLIAGLDDAWVSCAVRDGRRVLLGPWIGAMQAEGAAEPGGGWSWVTGEAWDESQWAPHEPNEHPDAPVTGGENRAHYLGLEQAGSRGEVVRRSPFWNDMPDWPEGTAGEPGLRVVSFVIEFPR